MTQDRIPPETDLADPPSPRSQIAGLVDDVRNLAEAEWQYARARLSYSGGVVRKAGIYALLAIVTLIAAAIALVLGILLIMASYWGPWIATLIVVLLFGFAAFVFAISARKTARNLNFGEEDHDDRHGS